MSDVKRFVVDMQGRGEECVLASDYDDLDAECERVRAANLDCVDHFNQAMAARDAALAELATVKDAVQAWSEADQKVMDVLSPIRRALSDMLATAQPAADGDREAFEAWAASVGYHTERDMFQREKYQSSLTWELWRVWQARAAQPQQAVAVTDEVRRLREALESKVPLYEAVERACGDLPDGWAITLQMENGAGWVELYDAEGNQVEDFPTNNERLDYTLCDAVDAALAARKTGEEE